MSDLSRDEFIDALKDKKKDFSHLDFQGMDLRGIDLQRVNFSGANLAEVKLNGNRLTEANLSRADLTEAQLPGCKLMGANLEAAILHKADLADADLTGARLQRADLRSADLSRAICAEADLRGADLTRAKLSVVDFRLANLGGANLTGAMMRGALLRGADLREAILEGASGVERQLTGAEPIEAPPAPAMPQGASTRAVNPAATRQNLAPQPAATHVMPQSRTSSMPAAARTQASKELTVVAGTVAKNAAAAAARPKVKKYHPPLRHIPALIFTSSGWIRGQFHVPVMHGFLDFLNRMGELLKLTDVTLPHLKRELAFFGLRRDSAIMIIPDCEEDLLSLPVITGNSESHVTYFLMATGSVSGTMTIEADIRISDYLNQGRWVVLRDCEVGSHAGPTGRSKVAAFPLLVLNTTNIIGTSDENPVSYE